MSAHETLPFVAVGSALFLLFLLVAWMVRLLFTRGLRPGDILSAMLAGFGAAGVVVLGLFAALYVAFPAAWDEEGIAAARIASVAIGFAFKDAARAFALQEIAPSSSGRWRVRLLVPVGHRADIEAARAAIRRGLDRTPGVLFDAPPWIYVSGLARSVVTFAVYFRVAPPRESAVTVSARATREIERALREVDIEASYPHETTLLHEPPRVRREPLLA